MRQIKQGSDIMQKKISILLVFALLFAGIAPAASAAPHPILLNQTAYN